MSTFNADGTTSYDSESIVGLSHTPYNPPDKYLAGFLEDGPLVGDTGLRSSIEHLSNERLTDAEWERLQELYGLYCAERAAEDENRPVQPGSELGAALIPVPGSASAPGDEEEHAVRLEAQAIAFTQPAHDDNQMWCLAKPDELAQPVAQVSASRIDAFGLDEDHMWCLTEPDEPVEPNEPVERSYASPTDTIGLTATEQRLLHRPRMPRYLAKDSRKQMLQLKSFLDHHPAGFPIPECIQRLIIEMKQAGHLPQHWRHKAITKTTEQKKDRQQKRQKLKAQKVAATRDSGYTNLTTLILSLRPKSGMVQENQTAEGLPGLVIRSKQNDPPEDV